MTWNAAFPTQATNINQSTPQLQVNWAYIATTVGTDHYFNTGNSQLDGHHQFVQMLNSSPNPAIAVGMSGVEFFRLEGPSNTIPSWPSFKNATKSYAYTLATHRQFNATVPGAQNLFTFTGIDSPMAGTFFASILSGAAFCTCNYVYNGTTLTIINPSYDQSEAFTNLTVTQNGGSFNTLTVSTNSTPNTISWTMTNIPFGT